MVMGDRVPHGFSRSSAKRLPATGDEAPFHPHPRWFNPHGVKMKVMHLNKEELKLTLAAASASLVIDPYSRSRDTYRLKWNVGFSVSSWAGGQAIVSRDVLRAMFGLSDAQPYYRGDDPHAQEWRKKYHLRADSVLPNLYIRSGNHLNIPCAGSGEDGDPNLSVFIHQEIKEMVGKLLKL